VSRGSLSELVHSVNKKHGSGTIVHGKDVPRVGPARVTTGSVAFDWMLGGGWPLNQWNEIIGNPSNGKTAMVLKTLAANQAANKGHETLWIASEGFVPDWAEKLGVDVSRVGIVETNIMEEAYEVVIHALEEQAVDAIIIDSLPNLSPGEEAEKEMGQWQVGLGARLTNKFTRKAAKSQKRTLTEPDSRDCLCIIINQWRQKVGLVFGDPRTTPGGQGKDYAYFTRVEVARDGWIEEGVGDTKRKVGLTIKARTIKNKTAPQYRSASVDFYFSDSEGFHAGDYDSVKEVFTLGVAFGIIERPSKVAYEYRGEKWNGAPKTIAALRDDPDLRQDIADEIRELAVGVMP
jgi:recombination protein RecA